MTQLYERPLDLSTAFPSPSPEAPPSTSLATVHHQRMTFDGPPPILPLPSASIPMPIRKAMGELPAGSGHMLGLTTIVVGTAAYVGLRMGGGIGAASGTLFGGAFVNGYRAMTQAMKGTPESKREALVSGTYAVLAAALGGYAAYRASRNRSPKSGSLRGVG